MNWIKLSEQEPKTEQAIWMYSIYWSGNRVAFRESYCPVYFNDKQNWFWQPAQVPLPPPDEGEEAFEKWWKEEPYSQSSLSKGWSKAAWEAGRNYERGKK